MNKNGKFSLKFPSVCLLPYIGILWLMMAMPFFAAGQVPAGDSAKIKEGIVKNDADTIKNENDSSAAKANLEARLGIRISPDALSGKVVATATDSAVMDMKTNDFRLYGEAKVDYEDMKLSADHINFNQATNVATATQVTDTSIKKPVLPTFTRGSEKFTYDHLKYNFKSQRAIVRNARSQYGEGYVNSAQIKRNADQSLYGWKNVYTTCSLPEPHFGIRAPKIKIIPDQAIATGSANIEIEGVPTPLFLPFGYFPISQSHRSGFLLPGYTIEQNRGLGFTKGGYYFYLNDYVDVQLQADIFTKGSYAGYLSSSYFNKYHYNGNVFVSYASNKTGEAFDPAATIQNDFAFRWTHRKDGKSLPGINFSADVNVQSGKFYQNNSYNATQILQNQYSSNITFAKNWTGTPFSLTSSATHNQNVVTGQVNVTLPQFSFYMAAQTPFQRKNAVGKAQWYEKITVGYTMNALNRITFYDTSLVLSRIGLADFTNGISHNIPISANYNVFRFLTMTMSANYNEYWNTESSRLGYNDITGKIDSSINRGFYASRDFNASFQLNTAIYGMKTFKKGAIKGIRHVMRPSVGLAYRPDFAQKPFNYYYQTRLDTSSVYRTLSPYTNSVIGVPAQGKQGSVTMNLNNRLEMKVRSRKDSTGFKKVVLIDGLDIGSSYNMAIDSFRWDYIHAAARTNILNVLNVTASAVWDQYQYDYVNNRRTRVLMREAGTGFARLASATAGFGASFHSGKSKKNTPNVNSGNDDDYSRLMRNGGYNNYVDFNVPWNLNCSYNMTLERRPSIYSRSDSSVINQNINLNGDFNLTPRWKIGFMTGYNVVTKQITMSSIDIYRDLHCWEMKMTMIPFGVNKMFNFNLNVKAQVLHDLRLVRRRDFRDAVY